MGVLQYFEKTLELFGSDIGQRLKAKLAAEKITPTIYSTYKLVDIQAALNKINGNFSCTIICNQRNSNTKEQIQEIRFSFTKDFKKQHNRTPSRCTGPDVLFPASA
ncbi:Zinc finger, GRF-type [Thalictrum thalictroides]|uniref:Zinc finger, GRF-type n=1 Tax=Thalictrum thalictroides TaxID=46969 RepID=A0A7J6XEL9_THATH|nr:Zinc finger, GRF-type [Thalictrum thalictroides]